MIPWVLGYDTLGMIPCNLLVYSHTHIHTHIHTIHIPIPIPYTYPYPYRYHTHTYTHTISIPIPVAYEAFLQPSTYNMPATKTHLTLKTRNGAVKPAWHGISQQPRPAVGNVVVVLYDVDVAHCHRIGRRRKRKSWFRGIVTKVQPGVGRAPYNYNMLTVRYYAAVHWDNHFPAEIAEVPDRPQLVKVIQRRRSLPGQPATSNAHDDNYEA